MAVALAFVLIILMALKSNSVETKNVTCLAHRCSPEGPEIRFPFSTDQQPPRCGYPGYKLFCNDNYTVLQLPSFGEVAVYSIEYSQMEITIFDSKNCNENLLLRFDPSVTPFNYEINLDPFNYEIPNPVLYNYGNPNTIPFNYDPPAQMYTEFNYTYTYINCSSASDVSHGILLRCLSTNTNNVYIVHSSMQLSSLPTSCQVIKTVSIPYDLIFLQGYLGYRIGNHRYYDPLATIRRLKFINLHWMLPGCDYNCLHCGFKNSHSNDTHCFEYVPTNPEENQHYFDQDNHGGGAKYGEILGICAGLFVIVVIAMLIGYYFNKHNRNNDKKNQVDIELFLKDYKSLRPTRYSYIEIKKITTKFKVKLGEGAYGTVFKGSLSTSHLVAIKVLKESSSFEEACFMNEVATIGRIHHVNIVRLLGFCAEGTKRALIYEFMPNKSLEKLIATSSLHNLCLNWRKILDIAIGISRGIDYLHQGCSQRILHFDIKPHNVLLDHNLTPKISDFGLAKLCSKEHSVVSISAARGTIGYIAPEVLSRNFGDVSYKFDVYSFGIMLLEMVGGRKSIKDATDADGQPHVPAWIYDPSTPRETIIPIESDEDEIVMRKLTNVALWCIQWYPVDRPSMKFVVQMLEGCMESFKMPPNPFAAVLSDSSAPKFESLELPIISGDEINEIQIEE